MIMAVWYRAVYRAINKNSAELPPLNPPMKLPSLNYFR